MPRLLFTKEGVSIWSSHLDLMRALMRSFRRAGIDLKHSQGFTPHPELSILMPLSVGVESQCEMAEFTLAEGCAIAPKEIVTRLNPVLPAGIQALDCWEDGMKAGKLAWLRARLTLTYEGSRIRDQGSEIVGAVIGRPGNRVAEAAEAIRALFARPSLVVEKHSKKGPVELDLIPMIRELTVSTVGGGALDAPFAPACSGEHCSPQVPPMDEATGNTLKGKGRQQATADGENGFLALLEMTEGEMPYGDSLILEAVVAAQNPTLNPLLLVTAIETHLPACKPDHVQCRRLELYDGDGKVFR